MLYTIIKTAIEVIGLAAFIAILLLWSLIATGGLPL